jgi:hypothetical protein
MKYCIRSALLSLAVNVLFLVAVAAQLGWHLPGG